MYSCLIHTFQIFSMAEKRALDCLFINISLSVGNLNTIWMCGMVILAIRKRQPNYTDSCKDLRERKVFFIICLRSYEFHLWIIDSDGQWLETEESLSSDAKKKIIYSARINFCLPLTKKLYG